MILYGIVFYFMVLSVFRLPPSFNLLHSVESTPKRHLTTHHSRQHINFSSICEIYWWFSIRSGSSSKVILPKGGWGRCSLRISALKSYNGHKGIVLVSKVKQKGLIGDIRVKKNMTNGYHWNSWLEMFIFATVAMFFFSQVLGKNVGKM